MRNATAAQLWRLNEEGRLRLEAGPPISSRDAWKAVSELVSAADGDEAGQAETLSSQAQ